MKTLEISGLTERNITNFWNKVTKTDECWLWTASKNHRGYGRLNIKNKAYGAHRVSYTIVKDEIPNGLQIDHLCKVRHCVNPDHLEVVTHAENVRRGDGGKWQKDKTHCKKGHKFTKQNTYMHPDKKCISGFSRECLTCKKERKNNV